MSTHLVRRAGMLLVILLAWTGAAPFAGVAQAAAVPATACTSGTGVTVVVDPGALGGGPTVRCAAEGGGEYAWDIFVATGHRMAQPQRWPGMVCRVDGRPSDAGCVDAPPQDAYWGLFWSDGSGDWVRASLGVKSLQVPPGGALAWAWQGGEDHAPAVPPPGSGAASTPATEPSPNGTDTTRAGPTTDEEQQEEAASGVPTWLPVGLVVLLGVALGITTLARRRRTI